MNIKDLIKPEHDGFIYDPVQGRLFQIKEINITELDPDGKHRSRRSKFQGIQRFRTHIVFFIMTGRWPVQLVDHKNNDSSDNKWDNLREATYEQNAFNRTPRGNADATLGTNVERTPGGRFRVKVCGLHIGTYSTVEEANTEALAARQRMYGSFDYHSPDKEQGGVL